MALSMPSSRAEGFTMSQPIAPRTANKVAVIKDASHPKCEAIIGVSDAVTAPPS